MDSAEYKYPAKLLLFGEHTVLKGSSSLAIPLDQYGMRWIDKVGAHPDWLPAYITYLKEHCSSFLNLPFLMKWIDHKTIEANIPIGYGLGSSGALTAAIYDVAHIDDHLPLAELQRRLGLMESFFHGKSSGFDPLVSYCGSPILKDQSGIQKLDAGKVQSELLCYLFDSGKPRNGSSMIQLFLENFEKPSVQIERLIALNNEIINSFLRSTSVEENYNTICEISKLQLENLTFMIPDTIAEIWKQGLSSDKFSMKICGAGGGGYFLIFAKQAMAPIPGYKLEQVFYN